MWWKVFQLILYIVVVFVICRLLEIAAWYDVGILSSVFVDPFSLSVKQLQRLLEVRGISYAGTVEKQELSQLVYSSGTVQKSELMEAEVADHDLTERSSHHFSCGTHFYEEVEDTKDGAWLVQVAAAGDETLEARSILSNRDWKQVVSKVSPFGVRTGIFDCNMDRKLCARKKWNRSRIILTLPRGHRVKDSVVTYTYESRRPKPQFVMNWVRKQMASQIHSIGSLSQLQKDWLNTSSCDTESKSNVRVVFISQLSEPPLFYSSLSYIFSGRVSFASWQVTKTDILNPDFQKLLQGKQLPLYLIITPENLLYYGSDPGQFLNFESLALYVQFLRPQTNDVFLFSLILLNLLMFFDLFVIGPRWGRHIIMFCWGLVKNNALFLTVWLCVLGLFKFSVIEDIEEVSLKILRFATSSQIGGIVVNDWKFLRSHSVLLASIIILYSFIMAFIKMKFHFDEVSEVDVPSGPSFRRFLSSIDNFVVGLFFCPISNLNRQHIPVDPDLEEGVELLLERLAMPNLWLQPVINTDYVKDLPVWQYRGTDDGSDTEDLTDATSQSSSEDENNGSSERSEMESCNSCLLQQQRNQNSRPIPSCSSAECRRRSPSPLLIKCTKKSNKCHRSRLRELFTRFKKAIRIKNEVSSSNINSNKVQELSNQHSSTNPGTSNQETPKHHRCGHDLTDDDKKDNDFNGLSNSWGPPGMLECQDCAICLERYRYDVTLCGLPCGHNYHQQCIMLWLARDNHQCPVCRWPTYKMKNRNLQASL